MKTTTILGGLLICSVAANTYLYMEMSKCVSAPACPVTAPFEPYQTIGNGQAREFANEYKMSLRAPDTIVGGIITRAALDKILCTADCNAISYTFAKDSLGKTGPQGNGVFVILSGLNIKEENGTFVTKDLAIDKYIPRHWCPPTCNPY